MKMNVERNFESKSAKKITPEIYKRRRNIAKLALIATFASAIGFGMHQAREAEMRDEFRNGESGISFEIGEDQCLQILKGAIIRPVASAQEANYKDAVRAVEVDESAIICDLEDQDIRRKAGTDRDQTFVGVPTDLVQEYITEIPDDPFGENYNSEHLWVLLSEDTAKVVDQP